MSKLVVLLALEPPVEPLVEPPVPLDVVGFFAIGFANTTGAGVFERDEVTDEKTLFIALVNKFTVGEIALATLDAVLSAVIMLLLLEPPPVLPELLPVLLVEDELV